MEPRQVSHPLASYLESLVFESLGLYRVPTLMELLVVDSVLLGSCEFFMLLQLVLPQIICTSAKSTVGASGTDCNLRLDLETSSVISGSLKLLSSLALVKHSNSFLQSLCNLTTLSLCNLNEITSVYINSSCFTFSVS